MSFKGFSIFSSGDPFVQQSRTILAILIKGDKRNISENHFEIRLLAKEEMFKVVFFLFLALVASFYQPSRTFLAILVKGHKRNTSVNLL